MPNYSQGKIYVIKSASTDRIYIGSTTMTLEARLREHRKQALLGGCCRSKEIVALPDHKIELLEAYPCATSEDLRRREGHHIKENAARIVNKAIAGRTPKEYREDNIVAHRKKSLDWYYSNIPKRREYEEKTKEKRLAYQKNYYQTVIKPQRLARRAAAAITAGSSNTGGGEVAPTPVAETTTPSVETAVLNPTSVSAAAVPGV
jgi:hypothetical protein